MTKTITATVELSDDQSLPFAYYTDQLKSAFYEVRNEIYSIQQKNDRMRGFDFLNNCGLNIEMYTDEDGLKYEPQEIQDEYFEKAFPDLQKRIVHARGDSQSDWQDFEITHKKDADIKPLYYLLQKAMTGTEEEYSVVVTEKLESGHSKEIDAFASIVPIDDHDTKKRMIIEDIQDRYSDKNILIDLERVY